MISGLHSDFHVLSAEPPAVESDVVAIRARYQNIPRYLLDLYMQGTEIELRHKDGALMRIWSPAGCIEMDNAYEISKRIPGAMPFGDDGGRVLLQCDGPQGPGIYVCGYGALDVDEVIRVAGSLQHILESEIGVTVLRG